MPHKRNPVKAEQLSGLARVLRGNLQAGLENVALWHERDISHSSVERIILPDSLQLAYYVLVRFRAIVEGMHVYPERMQREPRRVVRARVQPAGAARAGRVGHDARRRLPRGAAQRDDHLGVAAPVPRRPRATTPTSSARWATSGSPRASTSTAALANVDRTVDALDAASAVDRSPA